MYLKHILGQEFRELRYQIIKKNLNNLILYASIATPFLMMYIFWSNQNKTLMTTSTMLLVIYLACILAGIFVQRKKHFNIKNMSVICLTFMLSTAIWLFILPLSVQNLEEYLYLFMLMFLFLSGFIVIFPVLHIVLALFITMSGLFQLYRLDITSSYVYGLLIMLGCFTVINNLNRYGHEVTIYNLLIKHKDEVEMVKHIVDKDYLTGLYTNKYMQEQILNATHLYKRYHSPFSIMIIDIDNFRRLNDALGQVVGDEVIVTLANMIISSIRDTDIASRYSGKKFLILMQNTNLNDSILMAERLRLTCQEHDFEIEAPVTISIGLKSYEGRDINEYIEEILLLLRQAKMNGKNNIQY